MRAKDFTNKPDHEQEADYGDKYQAMVKRVGEKARAQEKAKQQQQQPKKEDLDEYTDPELARTMAYAGVHYPNYKKKPEAFMKWASRAIAHSEEQDTHHNAQFAELHQELDQIKDLVARISGRQR